MEGCWGGGGGLTFSEHIAANMPKCVPVHRSRVQRTPPILWNPLPTLAKTPMPPSTSLSACSKTSRSQEGDAPGPSPEMDWETRLPHCALSPSHEEPRGLESVDQDRASPLMTLPDVLQPMPSLSITPTTSKAEA